MVYAGVSRPVRLGWLALGESHAVLWHEKSLDASMLSRVFLRVGCRGDGRGVA
jgi:hypothetical protein